jgi:hypothetical protein
MKLPAETRSTVETLAKEAARRHYQRHNREATEEAASRFALRAWRSPEFIQAAADTMAIWIALDEAAAAPCN